MDGIIVITYLHSVESTRDMTTKVILLILIIYNVRHDIFLK